MRREGKGKEGEQITFFQSLLLFKLPLRGGWVKGSVFVFCHFFFLVFFCPGGG